MCWLDDLDCVLVFFCFLRFIADHLAGAHGGGPERSSHVSHQHPHHHHLPKHQTTHHFKIRQRQAWGDCETSSSYRSNYSEGVFFTWCNLYVHHFFCDFYTDTVSDLVSLETHFPFRWCYCKCPVRLGLLLTFYCKTCSLTFPCVSLWYPQDTEAVISSVSSSPRNKMSEMPRLESTSDLCVALDRVHEFIQLMQGVF